MSSITLYEASFGQLEKIVTTLIGILKKGAESPDAASLPTARLYEDMRPLTYQVFIVTRETIRIIHQIAGGKEEFPEDNATTMAELITAAEKALAVIKSVDPASVNGKEDVPFEFKPSDFGTWNMTGKSFIFNFAIPNVFFHLTIAYAILRNNGVPLGKVDFLASFAGPPSSTP